MCYGGDVVCALASFAAGASAKRTFTVQNDRGCIPCRWIAMRTFTVQNDIGLGSSVPEHFFTETFL
jgi:hypothetical protein